MDPYDLNFEESPVRPFSRKRQYPNNQHERKKIVVPHDPFDINSDISPKVESYESFKKASKATSSCLDEKESTDAAVKPILLAACNDNDAHST